MNHKKSLTIIIVICSCIILTLIILGAKDKYGLSTSEFNRSALDGQKITARIIEDLSLGSALPESETRNYVLKFYKGDEAISSYIAIPTEKIGLLSEGKLVVAIFDGTGVREGAIYIAEVVEDPLFMHAEDNPKRPPFIGPIIYESSPCFFGDDEKIEACVQRSENTLVLDWSPENSNIFPPWQESEAYGPILFAEAFQKTDAYARFHVPIDKKQLLATTEVVQLGWQNSAFNYATTSVSEAE